MIANGSKSQKSQFLMHFDPVTRASYLIKIVMG